MKDEFYRKNLALEIKCRCECIKHIMLQIIRIIMNMKIILKQEKITDIGILTSGLSK